MRGAANVKAGDIVQVDKKGRRFFALVRRNSLDVAEVRALVIAPFSRESYTTATSREVVGIYRKAKGSA